MCVEMKEGMVNSTDREKGLTVIFALIFILLPAVVFDLFFS